MTMGIEESAGYCAYDQYYAQLAARFNRRRPRGTFWSSHWKKSFMRIGALCIKHEFDIADYIVTCFDLVQQNHQCILPRDFATTEVATAYAKFRQISKDEATLAWRTQIALVTDMELRLIPSRYTTAEELLLDFRTPFEAWFRLLYLDRFSEAIFEVYGQQAWAILQRDARLRKGLRPRAPRNLAELERRIGLFGDTREGGQG